VSEKDELYRDPPLTTSVDDVVHRLDRLLVRVRAGDPGRATGGRRPIVLDPALVDDLYDRLRDLRDALEEAP